MGVLYQEQIADFSAQGLENSRVFFFFTLVTEKQTSSLFVCLGKQQARALSHSVTVSDNLFPLKTLVANSLHLCRLNQKGSPQGISMCVSVKIVAFLSLGLESNRTATLRDPFHYS